jgi:phage tail protein X
MANLFKKYRCTDGDRIDLIVLDHYKSLEMLPHVLAVNLHLCRQPLVLTSGTIINLPQAQKKAIQPKKRKGALW